MTTQTIDTDIGDDQPRLEFYGGTAAAAFPLFFFVASCGILITLDALAERGMILAAMTGLSVGLVLSKDRAAYCERASHLMANRVAIVAIICWLWAGAFSGILRESGLVEAVTWVGWKLNLSGSMFTVIVFLGASMFAVTVGTGMGTIIGFTAVMYPAGIVLGASPAALIGAIMSGAAFGDNMAPISDTTIVSATTQEADVGGVVRSRLKYTLVAGGLAALLFLFIGQGDSSMDQSTAKELLEGSANPRGLIMLIAAVVMVAMAVTGRPFLLALTSGIATAIIVGLVGGAFTAGDIVHVTDDGALGGALINGIGGMIDICVLTLVLVTSIGIMEAGGAHQRVMGFLDRSIAKTIRGAEFAIVGFISILNMCVSINTVAMVAGGPMVNEFRKRHGISKYRSANLLDTISCSFPYILPYSGPVLAIAASQKAAAESYEFVPIVGWSELIFHYHYGNVLFPLMIVAVITGYGRGKATD